MKKFITASILAFYATSSHADNHLQRFHLSLGSGYFSPAKSNFIDEDTKLKVSIGKSQFYKGSIGYEFAPGIHFEISAIVHNEPINIKLDAGLGKTRIKSHSKDIHANLIYDFDSIKKITPFFLFGLGASNLSMESAKISKAKNKDIILFSSDEQNHWLKSWNAGLGVNLALAENLDLEAIAKFQGVHHMKLNYNKPDTTGKILDHIFTNTIGLGEISIALKVKF